MTTRGAAIPIANGRTVVDRRSVAPIQQTQFLIPEIGRPWPFHLMVEPSGQWAVSQAIIDSTMAAAMLVYNRSNNRKPKPASILRFKNDMISERWRLTHEGIAFNSIGELIDGQHRLKACVETECSFPSLVFFGFDEMGVVNTGTVRDAAAAAKIVGMDAENKDMATLRNFLMGSNNKFDGFTNSEMLENYVKHQTMLEWSREVFKTQGGGSKIITGPVRGAFARAYYHVEVSRLVRMADVLRLEVPATEPGDRSVISLRNAIEANPSQGGSLIRRDTYCKTLRTIQAYMAGEDLKIIRPVELDHLYPIPTAKEISTITG